MENNRIVDFSKTSLHDIYGENCFNDAIMCSISHGGNSSAIGTIAGNIIGTSLGYYRIPNKLINNLEMNDVIK